MEYGYIDSKAGTGEITHFFFLIFVRFNSFIYDFDFARSGQYISGNYNLMSFLVKYTIRMRDEERAREDKG